MLADGSDRLELGSAEPPPRLGGSKGDPQRKRSGCGSANSPRWKGRTALSTPTLTNSTAL